MLTTYVRIILIFHTPNRKKTFNPFQTLFSNKKNTIPGSTKLLLPFHYVLFPLPTSYYHHPPSPPSARASWPRISVLVWRGTARRAGPCDGQGWNVAVAMATAAFPPRGHGNARACLATRMRPARRGAEGKAGMLLACFGDVFLFWDEWKKDAGAGFIIFIVVRMWV